VRGDRGGIFASCLLLLLFLLPLPTPAESLRSTEVVRLNCESEVARREITLFGNGTVRLREKAVAQDQLQRSRLGARVAPGEGELRMFLGELDPEMFSFYLERLRQEDLSEVDDRPGGMDGTIIGEWVDECSLRVALPGRTPRTFVFSQYDSLPLTLSRVVNIVRELPTFVADHDGQGPRIPTAYQGKIGDILERKDGHQFEVVGFTGDGTGLELQGLDIPITVYITLGQLRAEFRALLSQRNR